MTLLLILAILLLAGTDVFFTRRIFLKFGETAELNGLVRLCVRKLGLLKGLALGIYAPTVFWAIMAFIISPKNPSMLLSFLTGMRFMLFLSQLKLYLLSDKLKLILKNF